MSNYTLRAEGGSSKVKGGSATLSMTASFALWHNQIARNFRDAATAMEAGAKPLSSATISDTDLVRHRAHVTGSLLSSAAHLEATINEALGIVDTKEREATMAKYNRALTERGKKPFDDTDEVKRNAETVMWIRNSLMHYKMQSGTGQGPDPYGLRERVPETVPLNPFTAEGNLFFPCQCLSAGCAAWALDSAEKFIEAFRGR